MKTNLSENKPTMMDKLYAYRDQVQENQKRKTSTTPRGRKIYIALTVFIVAVWALAILSGIISSITSTKQSDITSIDYDTVCSIEGEYQLEVTNAQYNQNTHKLRFDLLIKDSYESLSDLQAITEESTIGSDDEDETSETTEATTEREKSISKPELNRVLFNTSNYYGESASYTIEQDEDLSWHTTVTVDYDSEDNLESCAIIFDYVVYEYTDEDSVDSFGYITKGETHEEEEKECYVLIAASDIEVVSEYKDASFTESTTEEETTTTTTTVTVEGTSRTAHALDEDTAAVIIAEDTTTATTTTKKNNNDNNYNQEDYNND